MVTSVVEMKSHFLLMNITKGQIDIVAIIIIKVKDKIFFYIFDLSSIGESRYKTLYSHPFRSCSWVNPTTY